MQKREFVSFLLLARQSSDSELIGLLSRLNEIGRDVGKYHETIVLRTPRRKVSPFSESQHLLLKRDIPNVTLLETSGAMTTASLAAVALERALGDFVVVLGASLDEVKSIEQLLDALDSKTPVSFGIPSLKSRTDGNFAYKAGKALARGVVQLFGGKRAWVDAPLLRAFGREVVTHILTSSEPALAFRMLGDQTTFPSKLVVFDGSGARSATRFWESYGSAMQIWFGGSKVPLRLASLIALIGAGLNVLYGLYVLGISLLDPSIERGWASLSLQNSGMFFLVCVVLFIMTEYLLRLIDDRSSIAVLTSTNFDGATDGGSNHKNVDHYSEHGDLL